jgi:hypothetical protein
MIIMGLKEEIVNALKEDDYTIDQIAYKVKAKISSVRTVINRDIKPSKTICETNSIRNKYKIYTLNIPENAKRHLEFIVSYRRNSFGRIYAGASKIKAWNSVKKEWKVHQEAFLVAANQTDIKIKSRIKKEINTLSKQIRQLDSYSYLIKGLMNRYQVILNDLEEDFRNTDSIDLEMIFHKDLELQEIMELHKKWERDSKRFFETLSSKKTNLKLSHI